MYKSILLSVDLNHPKSWEEALPTALGLSKSLDAELHLVTVVPRVGMSIVGTFLPEDFEKKALKEAGEALHEFAEEHIPEGVRGKSHVAHGVVREEILNAANTLKCDLIVMAPHRRGLQDILIGPNTEYVARHATQSVLVVRES